MLKRVSRIKNKTRYIYILSIITLINIVYLASTITLQVHNEEQIDDRIALEQDHVIQISAERTMKNISGIMSDLLYITDSLKLHDNNLDVQKQWKSFAERKQLYDQIRFIDKDGNEVVRVNYDKPYAEVVSKQELQNKADRYYFQETIGLKENQVYLSQLDLNIENNEIEQPLHPMIRVSTPYYNDEGELEGIVILNYCAKDMLDDIKTIAQAISSQVYLLNADSYWLFNEENSEKEWGFMYDDRQDILFSKKYTDEWEHIVDRSRGNILTPNGLFTFSSVLKHQQFLDDIVGYSVHLGDGDWYLVAHAPDTLVWTSRIDLCFNILRDHLNVIWITLFAIMCWIILFILDKI